MRHHFLAGTALIAALSFHVQAGVIPYPNAGTVAAAHSYTVSATGDLIGIFCGSSAYYEDKLGVLDNGVALGGFALDNQTSTVGQSFDFGHVNAGDAITYLLSVNPYNAPVYTVTSNPALNSDSINHVYATSFAGGIVSGVNLPAGTYVAFEDLLLPLSDLDYNDSSFIFQNVIANPEPSSLLLCASALAIAAGRFRSRIARR